MARRMTWREGERRVVSVTPVSRGVVAPALFALVGAAAVAVVAHYWTWLRHDAGWVGLVVVAPALLVVATRTWRWRSHKVHVSSERLVVEGGVARRHRAAVELVDVHALHVTQGVVDRLARRGEVTVETPSGPVVLGVVRHPAALVRLIERERGARVADRPPFDTVFDYEDPADHAYDVDPRWRRHSR
ncbi:MAG: PH domain-containing protein [Acidimicrobiales bacterium]